MFGNDAYCRCIGILLLILGGVLIVAAILQAVDHKDWIVTTNPNYNSPYRNEEGGSLSWDVTRSIKRLLFKSVVPLVAGILLVWWGSHKLDKASMVSHKPARGASRGASVVNAGGTTTTTDSVNLGLGDSSD